MNENEAKQNEAKQQEFKMKPELDDVERLLYVQKILKEQGFWNTIAIARTIFGAVIAYSKSGQSKHFPKMSEAEIDSFIHSELVLARGVANEILVLTSANNEKFKDKDNDKG